MFLIDVTFKSCTIPFIDISWLRVNNDRVYPATVLIEEVLFYFQQSSEGIYLRKSYFKIFVDLLQKNQVSID